MPDLMPGTGQYQHGRDPAPGLAELTAEGRQTPLWGSEQATGLLSPLSISSSGKWA